MTTKVKNQVLDILCKELARCEELLNRANNLYFECKYVDVRKLVVIRNHYQKLVSELNVKINLISQMLDMKVY